MRKKKYRTEHNKVDLHGVRHDRARHFVIRAVEDKWDSGEELIIVTGHSPKMKSIVKEILEEYKLDYTEGDLFNPGYIRTVVE